MTFMIASATVDDFEHWRENFAENDSFRTEHGQLGYQVFQSVDDPNDLTIVFEWDEEDNARDLFGSAEMKARMKEAGVRGRPDMAYFERIEKKSATKAV